MPLENKKLSDKPLVNTFTDKAVVHILEPEDFSQSPTGSDYRIKLEDLKSGLVPDNVELTTNKTDVIVGNETSSIKYPSVKGLVDWVTSLFVPKTRTITINGTTQDLSENRSFTVGGTAEVFEYMNFYISGNIPYNANVNLEPFPLRGNKDIGNLQYPGDFWNNVTSTTGDYRGTAQSVFKASNLVEVIVNSSGIIANAGPQSLQIRVVAFDVSGGSVTNPRSIAVKTLTGLNQLRTSIFLPTDINLTNVINPNTMISITATVKTGTETIQINDRCYISLKFKNI